MAQQNYTAPAPEVEEKKIVRQAPPTSVAAPASSAAPPSLQSKRPKLGRNILQEIQTQNEQTVEHAEAPLELTQELAEQLLTDFKDYLRNEAKQLPVAAQMDMMSINCISNHEMQLVCVSDVNHIYAMNQREPFMDYCKKITRIDDVRVMVNIDPSARKEEVVERKLNKLEIFEMMAAQNPAIKLLKDSLNLNIE